MRVCVYKMVVVSVVVVVAAVAFAAVMCWCVRVCVQRGNETKCYKPRNRIFVWTKGKRAMCVWVKRVWTFLSQTDRIAQFSIIGINVHAKILWVFHTVFFSFSTMYGCGPINQSTLPFHSHFIFLEKIQWMIHRYLAIKCNRNICIKCASSVSIQLIDIFQKFVRCTFFSCDNEPPVKTLPNCQPYNVESVRIWAGVTTV